MIVDYLLDRVKYVGLYKHVSGIDNEARSRLEKYFRLYKQQCPHSSLDAKSPDGFYFDNLPVLLKIIGNYGKASNE